MSEPPTETYEELVESGRLVVTKEDTGNRNREYSIHLVLDGVELPPYEVAWDDDWQPTPPLWSGKEWFEMWVRDQKRSALIEKMHKQD